MADLSSILGGMVQGFKDFGTGLVDFFGTGAANIGDIASSIATGRATTKNQDDFRKWLYQTDDKQDAAAKGLGTILNGVSTVADVMPGAQAVTANPLFNGLQGAIGGVSDELKMAGKDADWGRAAQRAGVGAASGLASAYAGQGLAKTGNKLLSNGLTRGAISGALGGGIANAGYTGIEGGSVQDMINAGLYGAQTGALVGGTTGLARELIKPAHKMDVALTDEEKAARIANIDDQLGKLDLSTPEGNARYNELAQQRQQYSGNKRLYRGLGQEYDPNYPKNKLDTQGYESWTDNPELARQYGENVYYIDVPEGDIKTSYLDENPMSETYGDRNPIYSIDKKAGLNGVSGNEYLLSVDDPYKEGLTYNRLGGKPKTVADLMNEPKAKVDEMLKLYRGISAPDDTTLQKYIDDLKNPDIEPTNYSGGSAYGKGYYFTPDEGLARYYASESGLPSTAVLEIEVPKNRFTEISKAKGNRPADFDLAAVKRGVPEDIRYETGLKDFNDYLDNNGYWGSKTSDDGTYTIMRNDAVLNAKRLGDTPKTVADLMLSPDADIMASAALPGSNKKAKTTNGVKRIGSDNVAPVDESTLPKGWKELRDILDEKYVDDITKKFGYENGDFSKITPEQYEKYILDVQTSPGKKKGWQNQFEFKKSYMDADEYKNELRNMAMYEAKRKAINDIQNMDLPQAQKNAIDTAINSMDYYATDDNRRYLSHYMPGGEGKEMFANNAASEADVEFSDRLGIGRSNTIKRNNIWSEDLNASGEYKPDEYALAVDPLLNKENAVSTLAHERLHSFQFETPQGRYDKRVLDAYNELSKDLKPYLHDQATVDKRYGKYYSKDNLDGKYWASNIEQESRMMQQYLDNKGYTNRTVDGPRKNEYGEEINKAFDKFFDKLRKLSKKGVALPAITALLGGGAIMAATQGDDKKKKSEVK